MKAFRRVDAHAKLNLGLKILRRRPDGYHDILSVMQTVDLSDHLSFEEIELGQIEIACSDPVVPTGPENLIHRAVEAFRKTTHIQKGVRVFLKKGIPVGAGLGGGSADAAAVLRVLNETWGTGLSDAQLGKISLEIGSDVGFSIRSGTAVASGRGEILRYVTWRSQVRYILVHPPISVSTDWAYRQASKRLRLPLTVRSNYVNFVNSIENRLIQVRELFACVENDFEDLVVENWPLLKDIRRFLRGKSPDVCSLSGSGSVLFGGFFDFAAAERAATSLRAEGYQVFSCKPLIVDP